MPTLKKPKLERSIQQDILDALGCEPGLIVMRNYVAKLRAFDDDGKQFRVSVGLGEGTPDIVGILLWEAYSPFTGPRAVGQWFALEVKQPGKKAEPHQAALHAAWRKLGAFVATVTSVDEAKAALERARRGGCQ